MTGTDLAPAPSKELKSLAREIQDEHLMFEQAGQSMFQHAVNCGEMLIQAKAQVKHGEWMPWVEANFPDSYRLAASFMQAATAVTEGKLQASAHLTLDAALAELAEPREVSEPEVGVDGGEPSEDATALSPEPNASGSPDKPPAIEDPEPVQGEVVEPTPTPDDPGPRVQCPTCGHMVKPNDLGVWNE